MRARWVAALVLAVLVCGPTAARAVPQTVHVPKDLVNRAMDAVLVETGNPFLRIIKQGSWISGQNYRNPLDPTEILKGASDHDARLFISLDDVPAEKALSTWKSFKGRLVAKVRALALAEAYGPGEIQHLLKSVNFYPPTQALPGSINNDEILRRFWKEGHYPNLLEAGDEGAEGLYTTYTKFIRQKYETGVRVSVSALLAEEGSDSLRLVVRNSAILEHMVEGVGPENLKGYVQAAEYTLEQAKAAIREGNLEVAVKNIKRSQAYHREARRLAGVKLEGGLVDEIGRVAGELGQSTAQAFNATAPPAGLPTQVRAIKTAGLTKQSIVEFSALDTLVGKEAVKQLAFGKGVLEAEGKFLGLRQQLEQVADAASQTLRGGARVSYGTWFNALFVLWEADGLPEAIEKEGVTKATARFAMNITGLVNPTFGALQLLSTVYVTVGQCLVDYVSSFGYAALVQRQDCNDLIAGLYTVPGRETQVEDKTCEAIQSGQRLACRAFDAFGLRKQLAAGKPFKADLIPPGLSSLLSCHAKAASTRYEDTASTADTGVEKALIAKCLPRLVQAWVDARQLAINEIDATRQSLEESPLGVVVNPEKLEGPGIVKLSVRDTMDVAKALTDISTRAVCLGGAQARPSLRQTYAWTVNGQKTATSAAAEHAVPAAGAYEICAVMELFWRVSGMPVSMSEDGVEGKATRRGCVTLTVGEAPATKTTDPKKAGSPQQQAEAKYAWLKSIDGYLSQLIELNDRSHKAFDVALRQMLQGQTGMKAGLSDANEKLIEEKEKRRSDLRSQFGQMTQAQMEAVVWEGDCYYNKNRVTGEWITVDPLTGEKIKPHRCTVTAGGRMNSELTGLANEIERLRSAASPGAFLAECLGPPNTQRGDRQRDFKAKIALVVESRPLNNFKDWANLNDWEGYLKAAKDLQDKIGLPDPLPKPAVTWKFTSPCGGVATTPAVPLTVSLTASPKLLVPPVAATLSALATGGQPPYSYAWSAGVIAMGTEARFSSTSVKAGVHTVSVKVTDAARATASADITLVVDAYTVTLKMTSPRPDPAVPGQAPVLVAGATVGFQAEVLRNGKPTSEFLVFHWQPHPEAKWANFETSKPTGSVRFVRPGRVTVWVQVLRPATGGLSRLAESEPLALDVTRPELNIVFTPDPGKEKVLIGQEVKARLNVSPASPDLLVRWSPLGANAQMLRESPDGREIAFKIKDERPVTVDVFVTDPSGAERLGKAQATITGKKSEVTVTVTGGKTKLPNQIWVENKGLVTLPEAYKTDQGVSVKATVAGRPDAGSLRWSWKASDGCQILNQWVQEITVSRRDLGSCECRVTVTEADEVKLGEGSAEFSVTVTDQMIAKGKAAASGILPDAKADADLKRAQEQWDKGLIDDAVSTAEGAAQIDKTKATPLLRRFVQGLKDLGWSAFGKADHQTAIRRYEQAVRLDPTDIAAVQRLAQARDYATKWPIVENRARMFDSLVADKKVWSAQKVMYEIQDMLGRLPNGQSADNPVLKRIMTASNAAVSEYHAFVKEKATLHAQCVKDANYEAMLRHAEEMLRRELTAADEKEARARVELAKNSLADRESAQQANRRTTPTAPTTPVSPTTPTTRVAPTAPTTPTTSTTTGGRSPVTGTAAAPAVVDGTYSGRFTGGAAGTITLTVKGSAVSGSITGDIDGMKLNGTFSGTVNAAGRISTVLTGGGRYEQGTTKATIVFNGTIDGALSGSTASGTWKATNGYDNPAGQWTATRGGSARAVNPACDAVIGTWVRPNDNLVVRFRATAPGEYEGTIVEIGYAIKRFGFSVGEMTCRFTCASPGRYEGQVKYRTDETSESWRTDVLMLEGNTLTGLIGTFVRR